MSPAPDDRRRGDADPPGGLNTRTSEGDLPPVESDPLSAERSGAIVNRVRSLQSRVTTILSVGLMAGLGFALLAWYYSRALSADNKDTPTTMGSKREAGSGDTFLQRLVGVPEPPPPALPPASESGSQGSTHTTRAARGSTLPNGAKPQTPREFTAPVYARHRQSGGAVEPPSLGLRDAAVSVHGPSEFPAAAREGGGDLSSMLRAAPRPDARAYVQQDPQLIMEVGTTINCTLESAIQSSLPGMTRCITATDTWSADGTVVLLERGTEIRGETQGIVAQGANRLFVLWREARTPLQVVVPLDSPGADALGRSGLTGHTNYHFWQRFGAGIAISVVDGAIQAATRDRRRGGGDLIVNTNPSRELLLEVLRTTKDIRPTVGVSHGDVVQVFVARDVDFGGVYELRSTR